MTEAIPTKVVDGTVVVTPMGALDVATSQPLHAWLHGSIDNGHERVVLDLSETEFIDSTALRVLVSVHKRLREASGRFAVVCPHARIRRIFDLTALDRVLTLTDTVDGALVAIDA